MSWLGRYAIMAAVSLTTNSSAQDLGALGTVRLALRQFGLLGSAARYLVLKDELARFVRRGQTPAARRQRRELLARFARVHRQVPCAHSPLQFALMADKLLSLDVPGPMVQCGAFKGGSTAKLSILAALTGRKLYVCDSFEGLPKSADNAMRYVSFGDAPDYVFGAGEYAGSLPEVQRNVSRAGVVDACEFVEGWFADSLPGLDVAPAFVFTDVDYVSSARDCLKALWPRLAPGGVWFTHEAMFLTYVEGIMDPAWWAEHLGQAPPVMIGAGAGLSAAAPSIAYFEKR